jgi:hypothetical protein
MYVSEDRAVASLFFVPPLYTVRLSSLLRLLPPPRRLVLLLADALVDWHALRLVHCPREEEEQQ